jgi:hypothetical protein
MSAERSNFALRLLRETKRVRLRCGDFVGVVAIRTHAVTTHHPQTWDHPSTVPAMSPEKDPPATKTEEDDPPVIKTKLNFKRGSSQTSGSAPKRRKGDRKQKPTTNGTASSSTNHTRKPDYDFTMEDDDETPLPKISKVFWPDKYTFKDALFSALSDPDDARHWAQVFGSEIHVYPRPRATMSDDEYAAFVRERVYSHVLDESRRRREAHHRREEARRRAEQAAAQQRYYEETKRRMQEQFRRMYEAQMRTPHPAQPNPRNLRSAKQRWDDYLAAFQPPPPDARLDLLLLWQQSDVPWPTPSGLETDISEVNVRNFIKTYAVKYSEQAGGDWKKAVRQNQYFWHPDKFRQIQARKLEKLSEEKKEAIMKRVTEVSQILNKLAKE